MSNMKITYWKCFNHQRPWCGVVICHI